MEDITVVGQWESDCLYLHAGDTPDLFWDDALWILDTPRQNEDSICMRMEIDVAFKDLLRHAHPKAVLEVTRNGETFVKDGDKVYAKRLPLIPEYVTQDVSRLEEVSFSELYYTQWSDRLSGMQLRHARVDDPYCAMNLGQNLDLLEITAMVLDTNLDSILDCRIREVRILSTSYFQGLHPNVHEQFLAALGTLLYYFGGEVVSIQDFRTLDIRNAVDGRLQLMMRLINCMKEFEARGGHAASIRAWTLHDHAHLAFLCKPSLETSF